MTINFNKLEKLGSGREKEVYVDPDRVDGAVARFKEDARPESQRQLKGRYYLTKILHLLRPKNIPDAYMAAEKERRIMGLERKRIKPAIFLSGEEQFMEFTRFMWDIGIRVDSWGSNLGYDDQNNLVYIDNTFRPWDVVRGQESDRNEIRYNFDEKRLLKACNSLGREEKERALNFLRRLRELAEEEFEETKNNRAVKRGSPPSRG